MSPKRRSAILASLAAGNVIRRSWKGANSNGWLSHNLEGIKNLRETECEELRREGVLRFEERGEYERRTGNRFWAGSFAALTLTRSPGSSAAIGKEI